MSFISSLVRRSIGRPHLLYQDGCNAARVDLLRRPNCQWQHRARLGLRGVHHDNAPTKSNKISTDLATIKLIKNRDYHAAFDSNVQPSSFRFPSTQAELLTSLKSYWQKHKDFFEGNTYPEAPVQKKKYKWVMWSIFGVNITVWASFVYGINEVMTKEDTKHYDFMTDNFCLSVKTLQEGRVWTIITNGLAHQAYDHLLTNMAVLYYFAPPLAAFLGPGRFVAMYVGSELLVSAASLGFRYFQRRFIHPDETSIIGPQRQPFSEQKSLGASGSNFTCVTLFLLCAPYSRLLFFSWIPTPVWIPALYLLGSNAYELWNLPADRTDHGAHLGGVLAGFLFWRFGLGRVRYASLCR